MRNYKGIVIKKEDLTQEIVRELLNYDPQTGALTWRKRDIKWFQSGNVSAEHLCKSWNAKYAGKEALGGQKVKGYKLGAICSCTE